MVKLARGLTLRWAGIFNGNAHRSVRGGFMNTPAHGNLHDGRVHRGVHEQRPWTPGGSTAVVIVENGGRSIADKSTGSNHRCADELCTQAPRDENKHEQDDV